MAKKTPAPAIEVRAAEAGHVQVTFPGQAPMVVPVAMLEEAASRPPEPVPHGARATFLLGAVLQGARALESGVFNGKALRQ